MNYIEWALQRGAELWRAREETLKKRLSLVPEGTAQKKAAEAQLSEEEAAAQDAEMSGGAETAAEAADDPGDGGGAAWAKARAGCDARR